MRAFLCVSCVAIFAGSNVAGDPKGDSKGANDLSQMSQWNTTYLEQEYGLKVKAIKFVPKSDYSDPRYELLAEFVKEVDGSKVEKDIPKSGTISQSPAFHFFCFDCDNVVLGKSRDFCLTGGELTGHKGDAVRLTLRIEPSYLGNTRRIEVRPAKK